MYIRYVLIIALVGGACRHIFIICDYFVGIIQILGGLCTSMNFMVEIQWFQNNIDTVIVTKD